jgi:hypothetical protein
MQARTAALLRLSALVFLRGKTLQGDQEERAKAALGLIDSGEGLLAEQHDEEALRQILRVVRGVSLPAQE